MPNSPGAKKRLRQSIDRREHNRAGRAALRTQIRKLRKAVDAGDAAAAADQLKTTARALDQAAARKIIHKNAAARTKSRLNKAVKAIAG